MILRVTSSIHTRVAALESFPDLCKHGGRDFGNELIFGFWNSAHWVRAGGCKVLHLLDGALLEPGDAQHAKGSGAANSDILQYV